MKGVLRGIALKNHLKLKVGTVSGSLWEPVRLREVSLAAKTKAGTDTEITIANALFSFSWKNVLLKKGVGWFQKLSVDEANVVVNLPAKASSQEESAENAKKVRRWGKIPVPVELEAQKVNLTVRQGDEFLQLQEMQFGFQSYASGLLLIKSLVVHYPRWEKRFSQVYGGISLQDDKICASDVLLEPGLTLDSLAVSVPELENGKLNSEFAARAFSGHIRGEILSAGRTRGLVSFDASGSFSDISIGQLVAFLSSQEKATGRIKAGRFSFHGSPRNLPKATISTRFEAVDFQWRERTWNSLVVGASLTNRRLELPEFELKQAHNSLSLNGEVTLPNSNQPWWQADFECKLKAKLDNVTELSALLGPDIGEAAGQATIEGNVRSRKSSYDGQFIIAGSKLSYRSAPLDVLNAAVTLRDKEIEISHAEFAHKDDYFRAHGVVTLSGERRYTGEIKASVADLSLYASILQPPIAPYPFRGSLLVDWSGDGSVNSHSGAFRARLKEVGPLQPDAKNPDYTIHADMEATYAPEHLYFSKLIIGDADGNFSTKLTANPTSVNLEDLKIQQKGSVRMQGKALLPLSIWKAWQNPSAKENWDAAAPFNVNLAFNKLNLHESAAIFGREFPVRGEVQGDLETSGSMSALEARGKLELARGEIPLGAGAGELREIETAMTLSGRSAHLEKFSASLNGESFGLEGAVDAGDLQNPGLDLRLRSKSLSVAPRAGLSAKAGVDLAIKGSLASASVSGQAQLSSLSLDHSLSLEELFIGGQQVNNELAFELIPKMTQNWNLDVRLTGSAATQLVGTSGWVRPDATLSGSLGAARATGRFDFGGFSASGPRVSFAVQLGTLFLGDHPQAATAPTLFISGSGTYDGKPFQANIMGSFKERQIAFASEAPAEDQEFRAAILEKGTPAPPAKPDISLQSAPPKPAPASVELSNQEDSKPLPNLPTPELTSPQPSP